MNDTPELPHEFVYTNSEPNYEGMTCYHCLAWFNSSGLASTMGYPKFSVLKTIIEYDLAYVPNEDAAFCVKDYMLKAMVAESGVTKKNVKNAILPELKEEGFIDYWSENNLYKIKVIWDKLFEIYRELAYTIPFERGGLKSTPPDYTGIIKPTPFHHVLVVKGKVV